MKSIYTTLASLVLGLSLSANIAHADDKATKPEAEAMVKKAVA
jgi:hypothetical protein